MLKRNMKLFSKDTRRNDGPHKVDPHSLRISHLILSLIIKYHLLSLIIDYRSIVSSEEDWELAVDYLRWDHLVFSGFVFRNAEVDAVHTE